MKKLQIRLSSLISGRFESNLSDICEGKFALNRLFEIKHIFLDGKKAAFIKLEEKENYQIIGFDLSENKKIMIEYEGILDGTTGRYPYVKEKTTDDFYLLRNETLYYPVFDMPDTQQYLDALLYPDVNDMFQVSVQITNGLMVESNLKQLDSFTYEGYNPTFAVGCFKKYADFFGNIIYEQIDEKMLIQTSSIIQMTNDFMKKYKQAEIRDFKIIVIRDGYGSFVLPQTMFITSKGILDYQQLIHELIHIHWNPCCDIKVQRARFFDEALTQYFTLRTCEQLNIKSRKDMIEVFEKEYIQMIEEWGYTPYPICEYASHEAGDLSYSFGALALAAIENAVGRKAMDLALKEMLIRYEKEKIDFELFADLFGQKAECVFDDYFYSLKASDCLLGQFNKK